MPVRDAVSAGGVVARATPGAGAEVVLCGRRAEKLWALPKGTPDGNEPIEQTALREVREETGLDVEAVEKLGTIDYWFVMRGYRVHKLVHHWLMRPVGGDVADHDHEYDEVEWVPIEVALERVTYDNERKIVREAARRLGVEP
jgi:8-oxo-dGTP pyrophosphatase MutT (NUDIX family)